MCKLTLLHKGALHAGSGSMQFMNTSKDHVSTIKGLSCCQQVSISCHSVAKKATAIEELPKDPAVVKEVAAASKSKCAASLLM